VLLALRGEDTGRDPFGKCPRVCAARTVAGLARQEMNVFPMVGRNAAMECGGMPLNSMRENRRKGA